MNFPVPTPSSALATSARPTSALATDSTLSSNPRFSRRKVVATVCLGLIASVLSTDAAEMNIGVRTKITDMSHIWTNKDKAAPGTGGHSKLYGIYSVAEVKSEIRLVKPVDEKMILQVLSEEMNKNGFTLFAPGQKPDILITASYGRGEMQNPYLRDTGYTGGDYRAAAFFGGATTNDSGAPTVVITGAFAQQLVDEKGVGYEAKLQKAGGEKLFIRIAAWSYPTAKTTTKMLWKTIIVVDDPDHRDLNAIAAQMLAAGAPYFDKEIKDPEVDLYKPVPDGHVNVGTPEVVTPVKSK